MHKSTSCVADYILNEIALETRDTHAFLCQENYLSFFLIIIVKYEKVDYKTISKIPDPKITY